MLTIYWDTPSDDFKGFLVNVNLLSQDSVISAKSIAIDVSSDWSKFPRYGFLSEYSNLSNDRINKVIENLNRYHINGIQFYDWHWKHHIPLKGTPENHAETWLDIANRTNYFVTIERYITAAKDKNMMTMSYNLLYGALENAEQEGVQEEWYLFKDQNHSQKDFHDLSFWGHYIFLMNPASEGWKDYIFNKTQDVFKALDFDGWHVDQLGYRGKLYNYSGDAVDIEDTFDDYLSDAKTSLNKKLVMNAVNQYGYQQIAESPVDFLYTEVWEPNDTYYELANIIGTNFNKTGGTKNTIVAAYINRGLSGEFGYFNKPAVLLADAVIFAFGGAHIELGEHLLGNEYFPNNNLNMTPELKEKLTNYYDFAVAYQNLLRDERNYSIAEIESDSGYEIRSWSPSTTGINAFRVHTGDKEIFHLLNFTGTSTVNWADNEGIQTEPILIESLNISIAPGSLPKKVWLASPDFNEALPVELDFEVIGDEVQLTIPQLKYWNMLVFDSNPVSGIADEESTPQKFVLEQNYPNPFNPLTKIKFTVPSVETQHVVSLRVFDVLGREIKTLINNSLNPGIYEVTFDGSNLTSGIYFYQLKVDDFVQAKKMTLLK